MIGVEWSTPSSAGAAERVAWLDAIRATDQAVLVLQKQIIHEEMKRKLHNSWWKRLFRVVTEAR